MKKLLCIILLLLCLTATVGQAQLVSTGTFGEFLNFGWSTDGLVFYWRGIEAGNVIDESLYGNDGTIIGATWTGQGLSFDGDDYVDTGITEFQDGTSLFADAAQQWSVIVHAKVDTGQTGTFFAKAGAVEGERTFQLMASGGQIAVISRGTRTVVTLDTVDGKWHTYTILWDGVLLKGYADGVLREANMGVGAEAEELAENIIMGARTGGSGFLLTGKMDLVYIYNRALSAGEIQQLYINRDLPMQDEPIWLLFAPGEPPSGIVPIIQAHTRRRHAG